jgi:hypothetical protein
MSIFPSAIGHWDNKYDNWQNKWPVSKILASIPERNLGNMPVWRTNGEEATNMEPMNFERPDTDSLRVERIKSGLTKIAWGFLLIAGLVTFGLACLLSPTFLT